MFYPCLIITSISYNVFFLFYLPLSFLAWGNHIFINKMICLFPPYCLVLKHFSLLFSSFAFWSLCPDILFFIFYFFIFFYFFGKGNVYSMRKINDFEIGVLKSWTRWIFFWNLNSFKTTLKILIITLIHEKYIYNCFFCI